MVLPSYTNFHVFLVPNDNNGDNDDDEVVDDDNGDNDDDDDDGGGGGDCIDSFLSYTTTKVLCIYHYPSLSSDKDYDQYLWGENGPWRKGFAGENNRRPDVLTVQFGMHSCWHANPQGLYSKHLKEINISMIDSHIHAIPK